MRTFTHHIINSVKTSFGRYRQVGVAAWALALLAVAGPSALAQSSGQARPFKYTETGHGIDGGFVGAGNATHLGNYTTSGTVFVDSFDLATGLATGHNVVTYTAANGDLLFQESTWELYLYEPQLVQMGHPTFKGGTGRFAHATGEGTWVAYLFADGSYKAYAEGFINY